MIAIQHSNNLKSAIKYSNMGSQILLKLHSAIKSSTNFNKILEYLQSSSSIWAIKHYNQPIFQYAQSNIPIEPPTKYSNKGNQILEYMQSNTDTV